MMMVRRMKTETKHFIRRSLIAIVPIVIGVLGGIGGNWIAQKYDVQIDKDAFLEAEKMMVSVWGTLLGFIITAVSILMAFTGSRLTEEIKKTGHYKTILFCYVYTCFVLLICIIWSIPAVFLELADRYAVGVFICATVTSMIEVFLCLVFLALLVYSTYK